MKSWKDVPIPDRMQTLPKDHRGFPVPAIVYFTDTGKPEFIVNDETKRQAVLVGQLCSICGQPLEDVRYLVAGPMSVMFAHGMMIDPPGHRECIEYAMQVCPFMAMPSYGGMAKQKVISRIKSENEKQAQIFSDPTVYDNRPDVFVVVPFTRLGVKMGLREGRKLIEYIKNIDQVGPYEFWRHGEKLSFDDGHYLATCYMQRRQKEIAAEDKQLVE